MHKRLIGIAMQKIYMVQDLIKLVAYENRDGCISEKAKRWMVQLNDMLLPLIKFLAKATKGGWQSTIKKYMPMSEKDTTQQNIYMRLNLDNNAKYIGRTGDWHTRMKTHYKATCKHRTDAPQAVKCKSCRDHHKVDICSTNAQPHINGLRFL